MATDAGKYVLALSEQAEEAQWGRNEKISAMADELDGMQCHDPKKLIWGGVPLLLQHGPNFWVALSIKLS